jgi:hypothetical protein
MKKFLCLMAMALILSVAIVSAEETLDERTFVLAEYNQLCLLAFARGPFGPGETGIATLTCEAVIPIYMNYSFAEPFCTITLPTTGIPEITVRYILYNNELLFTPEGAANFTEVLE